MVSIDNGYGEIMPEKVPIEFRFDLSGRLMSVTTPTAKIPAKAGAVAGIVTMFVETFQNKTGSREVYAKSKSCDTLAPEERSFLYMDVGRWGGKRGESGLAGKSEHRDFGVVCGCHALLCKFHNRSGKKPYVGGSDKAAQNIYDVLNAICGRHYGVEITKWESIHSSKQITNWEPVYVFLGDLHLPIVTKDKIPKSEPIMGRVSVGKGSDKSNITVKKNDLKEWYEKYIYGNIFRGGGKDLLAFLSQLEIAAQKYKVHFFQVGDLYDLWIGLDRYYETQSGPPGYVVLKGELINKKVYVEELQKKEKELKDTKKFIAYWINRSNQCYPTLTSKLKSLKVQKKTFFYGNHDNYLARYTPGVGRRRRCIRSNGLYCEHGQWVDSANYDGASSGHSLTNVVFAHPGVRAFDPQRRHFYTACAALEYYKKPNFSVFVMGHTHMPYLSKVIVKTYRKAPAGGIAQPRDAGPG